MRALPMLGVAALAAAVIAVAPPPAAAQDAPTAHIQLETRQAYAELPFNLVVVAEGFDDDPAPEQPSLQIAGATVTPLGVEPRVQQSIQVVNGRRFESRETTWLLRWQVVAARAGNLAVPSILISQGAKKATAEGGAVAITEIATTDDMRLALVLPDRPVWVGETVPVEIDWLLRRQVHDQQLVVPMLSMPDDLLVAAGEASDPKQVLSVAVGASQLELPYDQDQVTVGGTRFTRLRFHVVVTPLRVGALTIAPAQVVASLEVGTGRDRFGFPSARTQLFRAVDEPRTLEVKPLPQQGRPPSFAGAVGTSFSIATQSSRSVVQLGEPVELEITVKGDTRLDGLSLGPLAGPGRLPADRFSMPDTVPPGELSDDGRTKVFKVQVQVTDPSTTEIPPLELAWFDPTAAAYHTAHSEPIALSVKGGTVVGAGDVVGGHRPGAGAGAATGSGGGAAADPATSRWSAPTWRCRRLAPPPRGRCRRPCCGR
ncbi:MAG: BatD family protein [Kofleriaceae bacterium]|nr:BatD family protein [Kofleriaceae bacterium]